MQRNGPVRLPERLAAFIALLLIFGAPTSYAADAAKQQVAPQINPQERLDELDEVRVYGKRLAERIEAAEDEFFALFNKLNRKDDYDITCGYVHLDPGSLIMSRACTAGLFARDYGAPVVDFGTCSAGNSDTTTSSDVPCVDGGYSPPSAEFILMAHREDMRRNMAAVIESDARLQAMASHLGDLHYQMRSARNRIAGLTNTSRKAINKDPLGFRAGPRGTL